MQMCRLYVPNVCCCCFLNTNCAWNSFTEQLYFDSSAKYLNCLFGHLPLQCSIYCQLIWCAWHVPPNNNPLDKAAYIAIDLAMESCFSPRDESTLNIPTWLGLLSISQGVPWLASQKAYFKRQGNYKDKIAYKQMWISSSLS